MDTGEHPMPPETPSFDSCNTGWLGDNQFIRYNRVIVRLSTHDQGGITEKDVELARRIEAVAPAG